MRLILDNITKSFGEKQVLKGAGYTFEKGKIYALLGRNGAGKTTIFNCINEDLMPDGGSVLLEQDGVTAPLQAQDVGYVLSTPSVPNFLTAREFIKFFIDINGADIKNLKTEQEYFDMVGLLEEDQDRLLKDFSMGMKNKIQMLINFIAEPKILLLDEPLTSFDVVVADEMKQLLRSLKSDHIIIFSTHIMELATELCDEIVILSQGQLSAVQKDKDLIIERLRRDGNDSDA